MPSKMPFFVLITCFLLLAASTNGEDNNNNGKNKADGEDGEGSGTIVIHDDIYQKRNFPRREDALRSDKRTPSKNALLIVVIFVAPFLALLLTAGLLVLACILIKKRLATREKERKAMAESEGAPDEQWQQGTEAQDAAADNGGQDQQKEEEEDKPMASQEGTAERVPSSLMSKEGPKPDAAGFVPVDQPDAMEKQPTSDDHAIDEVTNPMDAGEPYQSSVTL